MLFYLLIPLLLFSTHFSHSADVDIKISQIQRCDDRYYPVTIKNVLFEMKNKTVLVSGTLLADNQINSPVQASLSVKRYLHGLNVWLPVPCIQGIGSCVYENLCSYGKSQNETCPSKFVRDNVPCRCPIDKGVYEMKPDNLIELFKVPVNVDSPGTPATGRYFVSATVTSDRLLSCYDFYLDYDDGVYENEVEYPILPSVKYVWV